MLAGIPLAGSGFSIATQEQPGWCSASASYATFAQLAMIKAYTLGSPLIPATLSYATSSSRA